MKRQEPEIDRLWTFQHVKILPQEQIGVHQRNTWELSYVIKGQGERILDGNLAPFAEHDLVLVAPNVEHGWLFDSRHTDADGNIECITVQWTADMLSHLARLFPAWEEVKARLLAINQCAVFDAAKSNVLIDKFLRLDQCDDIQLPIALLDLIQTILSEITSAQYVEKPTKLSIAEQRLRQIDIYTSCNYARNISLTDVARHVGMNRSSFCSFFKRETGQTYLSYLNSYRLKVARQLIERRDESISTICWQCGFNDLGYFDRLFRREFGISPSEVKILNTDNSWKCT